MSRGFVVAGTDTDVGKTVVAAALTRALDAYYWKPIQSGLVGGSDADTVARLSGLPRDRIVPEAYRFTEPLSPHRAAEIDGLDIDAARLALPDTDPSRPLVVELAGGLMVPLTRRLLQIELVRSWQLPVVLVARTSLGTINHTLLSIHALRTHAIPLHGVVFHGPANPDSERTICEFGSARNLGRMPVLDPLDAATLHRAFADNFKREDFAS